VDINPEVAAVVGALVTVSGLLYRHLLAEKAKCDAEVTYWRRRYFRSLARSELVTDEADDA